MGDNPPVGTMKGSDRGRVGRGPRASRGGRRRPGLTGAGTQQGGGARKGTWTALVFSEVWLSFTVFSNLLGRE